MLYAAAVAALELLPATRHTANILLNYALTPLKKGAVSFYYYLPHLIEIIFIIFLLFILLKIMKKTALLLQKGRIKLPQFHPDWAMPTYHILKVMLVVFGFIFIFPHLPGSDSAAFKGVSVFLGVLLSLGSTSLISNTMSGLVITYMRPFKEGDYVKMGDVTGEIIEKNSLVTRIRTYKNEVITIPNSKIMTSDTINYTASAGKYGLILHASVTIGYEENWQRIYALLIEAAGKTEDILREPAPFVLQTDLENFAVKYEINAYTANPGRMPKIYSELYANIQDIFNREKIEIMTPVVNVIRQK